MATTVAMLLHFLRSCKKNPFLLHAHRLSVTERALKKPQLPHIYTSRKDSLGFFMKPHKCKLKICLFNSSVHSIQICRVELMTILSTHLRDNFF